MLVLSNCSALQNMIDDRSGTVNVKKRKDDAYSATACALIVHIAAGCRGCAVMFIAL